MSLLLSLITLWFRGDILITSCLLRTVAEEKAGSGHCQYDTRCNAKSEAPLALIVEASFKVSHPLSCTFEVLNLENAVMNFP